MSESEIHVPAQQDLPYVVAEMLQIMQDMANRITLLEMEFYRLGGFRHESPVN